MSIYACAAIVDLEVQFIHDDVIKWKYFPRNCPFVRGIHRSGEFPTQRPVTRSFDVFFDLRLNKRLSKQPWGWWFETPSWSLWRQCNDTDDRPNQSQPKSSDVIKLSTPIICRWSGYKAELLFSHTPYCFLNAKTQNLPFQPIYY